MKVGLSFSRCIKDIFLGEVDYEEVLIIIARTNFNPNDDISWEDIQRSRRKVSPHSKRGASGINNER